MAKIFSGRFLFTVAAAFVFVYGAMTKLISAELVGSVISTVVALYFSRTDRNQQNGEEKK